jgi:hypothetical protein
MNVERRLLQVINAALAVATVALGGVQLLTGSASPLYAGHDLPPSVVLDSNLRFFGGLVLGIGLVLLLITPRIERYSLLFAVFWGCAFVGGVGRGLSWLVAGPPSAALQAFTVIELLGAPLLIVWQRRVARGARPVA